MSAPITSPHAWLQRLSDYHSGAVSEAERIAVEQHLMDCAECQEALAMYRRFYSLLRSPLRLGGPSAHFDETTMPLTTRPTDSRARRPTRPPRAPRPPRRRVLAGLAAALAAALIIVGFVALIGPRLRQPIVTSTPSPRISPTAQPSATPQPSPTPQSSPTGTPQPSAFVCANPQGSNMTYAYVRGDGLLYVVTGCGAPRQFGSAQTQAIAWSPSNRYLAAWSGNCSTPDKVEIIDAQTGTITQTQYAIDFGCNPNPDNKVRIFFGWLDDSNFLGGIATMTGNPQRFGQPGPTTLVRVDVASGHETALGSIAGWVNSSFAYVPGRIVAHGRYLFYAGYDSAGTTAYLHRFDLTTGTDTQLVSLGLYTSGSCQGSPVCGWTSPWDVSTDGTHILYHHPGATSAPSDINVPKDTPVVYANPDGSGASTPFGSQLAAGLVTPVFAPNGAAALTAGSNYSSTDPFSGRQMKIVTFGGTLVLVTGYFVAWRGDSAALVVFGGSTSPALYDLATSQTTPLEANSNYYLWGN